MTVPETGSSDRAFARSFAIVVPVYRAQLDRDEELCLRHLEHYLPQADKVLVMPETLDFHRTGYGEERFDDRFFTGIPSYNRLMLSTEFYARFRRVEYLLVHQLDALVLRSDIEPFLAFDVDYLGAPWVEYDATGRPYLTQVGNGGLSLRRVRAFLRLLQSPPPKTNPLEYYRRGYSRGPRRYRPLGLYRACLRGLGLRPPVRSALAGRLTGERGVDFGMEALHYVAGGAAEDRFISYEAARYDSSFAFATVTQALAFAFEREPRFCLKEAGGRLPFGAHAWSRYDRAFWEPHLLR